MSPAEYIAILWKLIALEGVIIAALAGIVWRHFVKDKNTETYLRVELQRCKSALGLNGRER